MFFLYNFNMNNNSKKLLIVLIILFLTLGIIGFTFAYFSENYTFDNLFTSAIYQTRATEVFTSPESWMPGDTTPKEVTVTNTGNIPVKVRISYSEHWENHKGETIPNKQNDENVAIINLDNTNEWTKQGGYYYYNDELDPNETTSSFISSVTFNPNVIGSIECVENGAKRTCTSTGDGYDNATYTLTLRIETIQADVADEAWDPDDGTLYGIVKSEYKKNTTYAALYTGEHKDSFDREATKNIYYYTTATQDNVTQGNNLLNKINVLFAGYCWQMLRTTDTGGVKMIYNGIPVDGKCVNTRSAFYDITKVYASTPNLSTTYYYGTDYTYDFNSRTFKLAGTTIRTSYVINKSVIGMYTCVSTNVNATCSKMYYIVSERPNIETSAIAMLYQAEPISYASIGKSQYDLGIVDSVHNSFAYVGYMHNQIVNDSDEVRPYSENYEKQSITLLSTNYYNTNFWYSDSISYDSTNGVYSLVNPFQIGTTDEYPNLVGKYTFGSDNQNYTRSNVLYIAGFNDVINEFYSLYINQGNFLSNYEPLLLGESITNNNNNTYTLNNIISVSYRDYASNYSNYNGMYICNNNSTTCENPRHMYDLTNKNYRYTLETENRIISKTRNGLDLTDTLLVNMYDLINNYSNYSDYKYTCNNQSSICTEQNLRYITYYNKDSYKYVPNRYYGESVSWDGSKYTLNNVLGLETQFNDDSATHHYYCGEIGTTECSSVRYEFNRYYYLDKYSYPYFILKNGITSIDEIVEKMLFANDVNKNDSTLKSYVEKWYEDNLVNYDEYIDEAIYCNNRKFSNPGGLIANGGSITSRIGFGVNDLSCENITDQFSVKNNVAKLKFKIGLATAPEMKLLNNIIVRKINSIYWLMSPDGWRVNDEYNGALVSIIPANGSLMSSAYPYSDVRSSNDVRPVISLAYEVNPSSGTGTMVDPYVIN